MRRLLLAAAVGAALLPLALGSAFWQALAAYRRQQARQVERALPLRPGMPPVTCGNTPEALPHRV